MMIFNKQRPCYNLKINYMGANSSISSYNSNVVFQNFREEDWVEALSDNQDDIDVDPYGDFTTLQNIITKEQIDLYNLYFRSKQELNVYIQCFMQRTREDYLVNAIYLSPNKSNEFCSSIYTAKCYIQHMPIRLSGITDIPFLDTLYMLWCALHGFEKLFNTVGYFSIHEDHICIDKEGLVRVWMNCDLSKNYPEGYEDLGLSIQRQNTMVDEILEIIVNNSEQIDTEQNPNLIPFSEYLEKKGHRNPTFKEALHLLFRYLKDYDIELPTYCQSIIEIFNDEGEDYFLPNNDSGIERMLDNNKPQFSRSLQQIDQYKLSDFSQSKLSNRSGSIQSDHFREPTAQNFRPNESNSNNSNYFKHSYKEQLHNNLGIVKKSVASHNNRSSQQSKKSYRHSLKNRSSGSSVNHKKIINVPNINNTSHITSKMAPEDFNYLQMSQIREKKEQGLKNHHRLQSNYEGSYHTSKRSSCSSNQKQVPKFAPEPANPHYIDSGRGNHSRNTGSYVEQIDRCRGSAPITLMPQNQHLIQANYNGYLIPLDQNEDKRSSFLFNNSNAENEQICDKRPPRINFVYTNSVYNCSSNCNSLRDNTFSATQWNAQYKMMNKLRKKSEQFTVGFRKKKRTISSMQREELEEKREEDHILDPQILADLQKLRVEEVK